MPHRALSLLPLALLCLVGCPGGGGGGDNFLVGKWTAPEPCVYPRVEFTPSSVSQNSKQIGPYAPETKVNEVVYAPEGSDRIFVRAAAGAVNSVPYKRIDADHIVNENMTECSYVREG